MARAWQQPSTIEGITQDVLERYRRAGFALAGVAPVAPLEHAEHLRAWLGAGKHGSMQYLEQDLLVRCEPWRILEGTRAFIVVADQYATRNDRPEDASPMPSAQPMGKVARYARGRNYHEVMKRRLHRVADGLRADYAGSDFRTCVDTAPVPERELAVLAGLGWQAKNTMLIHPRLGSYLLLGVVATTMELRPASPQTRVPDSCGSCTRCIDACPTGAITPYSIDASRCVSYLTIERRAAIAPELARHLDGWIFGCDICQEVCPHNSPRAGTLDVGEAHPAYAPRTGSLPILDVLGWDEAQRRQAFSTSAMKRASLAVMKRNALLLAAELLRRTPDAALLARLRAIAHDASEPELVREAARAALAPSA